MLLKVCIRFTTNVVQEIFQIISISKTFSKQFCDLFQAVILMQALSIEPRVQVEGICCLLAFNRTKQSVATTRDSAQRLATTAEGILTWRVRLRAMRTIPTHAYAKNRRNDNTDVHGELITRA